MIYVDEIRNYPGKGDWCHMWTDEDEGVLHRFAAKIGLKRTWVHRSQGISGEFVHYDLRRAKRLWALEMGAVEKPLKEWIRERMAAQKERGEA